MAITFQLAELRITSVFTCSTQQLIIVLYVQQEIVKEFKLISRNKCEKLTATYVNILELDCSINLKDV